MAAREFTKMVADGGGVRSDSHYLPFDRRTCSRFLELLKVSAYSVIEALALKPTCILFK